MKRKHIGIYIGTFFIVAFISLIVATGIIVQKIIEDEEAKQAYFSSIYGVSHSQNLASTPIKFPAQSYASEEGTPEYEAIQQIRALHGLADFFLLGSKFDKYAQGSDEGWSEILNSELLKAESYSTVAEKLANEEDIVKDMNNLMALQEIAITQYEPDALRYIHRILHDLDLYGYPEQGKTASGYFGATYAVESSNPAQLNEITAYIKEKKETE